ncbi:MAG: transglutaminase-like domain-containing protein, partial [Verrucomicrobiota bacterium]
DIGESNASEVWKTPEETWTEKKGDCEDTSILLADALISAGFEARVAIGWNGNIGQHAWTVVKIEGAQYVIESTLPEPQSAADMMVAEEAAHFYKPEQLFDRDNLYFQNTDPDNAAADYFSSEAWQGVPSQTYKLVDHS